MLKHNRMLIVPTSLLHLKFDCTKKAKFSPFERIIPLKSNVKSIPDIYLHEGLCPAPEKNIALHIVPVNYRLKKLH